MTENRRTTVGPDGKNTEMEGTGTNYGRPEMSRDLQAGKSGRPSKQMGQSGRPEMGRGPQTGQSGRLEMGRGPQTGQSSRPEMGRGPQTGQSSRPEMTGRPGMRNSHKVQKLNRRDRIIRLVYLPAAFLFIELFFHILSGCKFSFVYVLSILFLMPALGMFCNVLCTISRNRKLNGWLGFAFLESGIIITLIFYFVNKNYHVFFNLKSLLNGAQGVVTEFSGLFWKVVLGGIPEIIFFEVPAVIFLILFLKKKILAYKKVRSGRRKRYIAIMAACEIVGLAAVLLVGSVRAKLTTGYNFDLAVNTFSLRSALQADVWYGVFGNKTMKIQAEDANVSGSDKSSSDGTGSGTETGSGNASGADNGNTAGDNENGGEGSGTDDAGNEQETSAKTVVYGKNELDINFDAVLENYDSGSDIAEITEYIKGLTASSKNEYTGLLEGKNLVLMTCESLSKQCISEEYTPTLYRMLHQGIEFEEFYQCDWNAGTAGGEFAVMTGLQPSAGIDSVTDSRYNNMYYTIGNMFEREDYYNLAFHDGTYDFYHRDLYITGLGYEQFLAVGNGLELEHPDVWPQSDLEMMEASVDLYINNQPFQAYYMTISQHYDYILGGNYVATMNWDYVEDMDASDGVKVYIASAIELEKAVKYLVDRFEEAGILDDTVFVMCPDHYPYGLHNLDSDYDGYWDCLSELFGYNPSGDIDYDNTCCIIWSPCLEDMDITVEEPSFSLDIAPTLANLFGIDFDSRLYVGRDVLSDAEAIAYWPDYSWKTEYGYYQSGYDRFTPADGVTVDDDYVERIQRIVSNKIYFNSVLLYEDYFNVLFECGAYPDS